MKIRSHIKAGGEAEQLQKCQKERDYWKSQAEYMEALANSPTPPSPVPPTPVYPPVTPIAGCSCGWVNGVYYADRSGTCG